MMMIMTSLLIYKNHWKTANWSAFGDAKGKFSIKDCYEHLRELLTPFSAGLGSVEK